MGFGDSGFGIRVLAGRGSVLMLGLYLSPVARAGRRRCRRHCAPPLPPVFREVARLRIVNDKGGEICISRDGGEHWTLLGHVVKFTSKVDRNGYTASKWVPAGEVAATAVNAIHISVGYNAKDDRGVVFSVLPQELLEGPRNYASFLSPDASIYTDIPAGHGIFGGGEAPFVSNPVLRQVGAGAGSAPGGLCSVAGRRALIIIVQKPRAAIPVAAVFENCEGGAVTLQYPDGSALTVGTVVKPVQGVGRFLGGIYAGIGRIRANHAGVIDVSTSPIGDWADSRSFPMATRSVPRWGTPGS